MADSPRPRPRSQPVAARAKLTLTDPTGAPLDGSLHIFDVVSMDLTVEGQPVRYLPIAALVAACDPEAEGDGVFFDDLQVNRDALRGALVQLGVMPR
jgi:hypothetical protein